MSRNPARTQSVHLDLKAVYPISALVCFRNTFWCLLVVLSLMGIRAVVYMLNFHLSLDPIVEKFTRVGLDFGAIVASVVWVGRFVVEVLERHNYKYGVQEGHLVLTRGVILKKRGFFPLSRITDVYLERSWIDVLFGLHRLHVATPTVLSEQFARIDGLTRGVAIALQNHLTELVNRASPEGADPGYNGQQRRQRGQAMEREIMPAGRVLSLDRVMPASAWN